MTYFLNISLFSPSTGVEGRLWLNPPLLFNMSRAPSVAQLVRMLIRQHSFAGKLWIRGYVSLFLGMSSKIEEGVYFIM